VRHHRAGKKLGRDASHRKALYSNLAGSLIQHGRIKTTVTKAKAVKPIAEQMITLGRRGDIHARRQAVAFLRSKDVVHLLFAEVAPRFRDRPGGYTRIVKIGPRPGDAAEMAYLEFVGDEVTPRPRRERAAAEPVPVTAAPTAEEPPATEAELVEEPVEGEVVPPAEEPAAEAEGVTVEEPPAEPEAVAETPAEDEVEGEPTGESQAAEPEQQP
jgi:large subunit ribosomal protein L17